MKILVLIKMVLDTVEEIKIDPSGKKVDTDAARFILNDVDNHAVEEAILLKEKYGGHVTVLAVDAPEIDDALFTAAAKGADRIIKVTTGMEQMSTQTMAKLLHSAIQNMNTQFDLILTGVQASDDIDGEIGPSLAAQFNLPYIGMAVKVLPDPQGRSTEVVTELGGGLYASYRSSLPVIVGISAAEKPPRYVPIMKVRMAMKSKKIETIPAPAPPPGSKIDVLKLYKPVVTGGAAMITGTPEQIADNLVKIFRDRGLS